MPSSPMLPDVKKLIAGFLVLASLASALALVFSGSPTPRPPVQDRNILSGQRVPSVTGNVFREAIPDAPISPGRAASSAGVDIEPEDPSNLTDVLAANMAKGVIVVNPQGPLDQNGNPAITAPDVDAVLKEAVRGGLSQKISLPDWDAEAAAQKIVIRSGTRSDDVQKYGIAIRNLFSKYLSHAGLSGATPEAVTEAPQDFDFSELPIAEAIEVARKIPVSSQLASAHQSLITLLIYQKNAIALREDAYRDPLRAALILNTYQPKYYALLDNFIKGPVVSMVEPGGAGLSSIARFFGANVAHAQWVVHDPAWDIYLTAYTGAEITKQTRTIWEWIQGLLLDVLRDQIIHRLINQIILWVQGGGSPQFITNWRTLLKDAANVAAGRAIEDVAPGLCRSFGPIIRLQLESTYLADVSPPTCTLDQVVQNVEDFYQDFTSGGWVGFGEMILPSGNYFGQLFEGSQIVGLEKLAAEERAKAEAQAASGFKGARICAQGGRSEFDRCQETEYQFCVGHGTNPESCAEYSYSACQGKSQEPDTSATGCAEWQTTTPGAAVADKVYQALGAPIQRIVNAQDMRALFSAFINAALYKLVKVVDGKPDQSGILGLQVSPADASCDTLSGKELEECLRKSLCERFDDPKEKQDCLNKSAPVGECKVAFGATTCPGQGEPTRPNCGTSPGSLAYNLRVHHADMYDDGSGNRYLWNIGAGGNPQVPSTWAWLEAPPADDIHSWCSVEGGDAWVAEHTISSPVSTPPPYQGTRCIDGTQGDTPPGAVTCTSSSTEPGGGDCGAAYPLPECNCGTNAAGWPEGGPQAGDFQFEGVVREAQDRVRARACAGEEEEVGITCEEKAGEITNSLKYVNAVGEEVGRSGVYEGTQSTTEGDDAVGVRRQSDHGHVEYFDIVVSPDNGGRAWISPTVMCKPDGNPKWP